MNGGTETDLVIDVTVCKSWMDYFQDEEEEAASAAPVATGDAGVGQNKEFSMTENNGHDAEGGSRDMLEQMANPTQLIIFYNGAISVYDSVPAEKVQAIMLIAAATASAVTITGNHTTITAAAAATIAPAVLARTPSQLSSSAADLGWHVLNSSNSLCKLQAELPLARRQSLQSFLEKRRDRLVSKAPYASAKPCGRELASEMQPYLA